MMFLGLEVGSWADWFSAVGSIVAASVALFISLKKPHRQREDIRFAVRQSDDPNYNLRLLAINNGKNVSTLSFYELLPNLESKYNDRYDEADHCHVYPNDIKTIVLIDTDYLIGAQNRDVTIDVHSATSGIIYTITLKSKNDAYEWLIDSVSKRSIREQFKNDWK